LGIAAVVASSAVTMALTHLRRIARATRAQPQKTAEWLRRFPPEERVGRLAGRVDADCWEGQLCEDLVAAPSESTRLAAVNAALGDAAHELEASSRLPFVAVRMSVWSGLLLAIFAYLQGAQTMTGWICVVGAVGAVVSWGLGRRARRLAESRRRGLDELVHVLTGGRGVPGPSAIRGHSASGRRRSGKVA